jgi:hypothetical protein
MKYMEGSFVSSFDVFLMPQKLMVDLGSLHALCIRALFTNSGFGHHIHMLLGDAGCEEMSLCYPATKCIGCKYGSDK